MCERTSFDNALGPALDHLTSEAHDRSMRILLIEDDERLGPLVVRLLSAERHTVQLAATGAEGAAFWESHDWDLVILDRMLPDTEGSILMRARRHAGDITPVLMLTALGTIDDRVEGLDSGADDYLTKPFAASELLARVRTQLRKKRYADKLRHNVQLSLEMAITDGLTGLHNRRYMTRHLDPNGTFYAKGLIHPADVVALLKEKASGLQTAARSGETQKARNAFFGVESSCVKCHVQFKPAGEGK